MPDDQGSSGALLSAALQYQAAGWAVVRLHRVGPDKITCSCRKGRNCGRSAGKHPVINEWQLQPPMTAEEVTETWTKHPKANIGLACGPRSGFWVLDVDPDGVEAFEELVEKSSGLPQTRVIRTPRGTHHYYWLLPDFEMGNSPGRLPKGIDVRGDGGQVAAPPSVTPNGTYELVVDVPIAAAPEWLLELVRPTTPGEGAAFIPEETQVAEEPESTPADIFDGPASTPPPPPEPSGTDHSAYTQRAIDGEIANLKELAEKGWHGPPWNNTTFHVTCRLIELANSPWNDFAVGDAFRVVARNAPRDENFDDDTIRQIFKSALNKVGAKVRPEPEGGGGGDDFFDDDSYRVDPALGDGSKPEPVAGDKGSRTPLRAMSDVGNGHRMADQYADKIRYVVEADSWMTYADGHWSHDGKVTARHYCQKMVTEGLKAEKTRWPATPPEGDPDAKETLQDLFGKWANKQAMSARIDAALREAATMPELRASAVDFDAHPMLLNVLNGVVDLRTGKLLDHDPALMLQMRAPVIYDPNAKAPKWVAFLERTQPNVAMRRYLQMIVGYSITGLVGEQALFMHHGQTGSNGKSVFLEVMTEMTGDYGQTVPRSTLILKRGEEHPTSTARMVGKRFLQTSETKDGRSLDEEAVKGLTGGENQTARFMGKDFFDFKPTGKIHYVTNHLPKLTDANSIWRRMHLVGWRVTIPDAEQNKYLSQEIAAEELAGVLNWAIEGCRMWLEAGTLERPDLSQMDLAEYREDMDLFGHFITERLIESPGNRADNETLYGAYNNWAFMSGIKPYERMSKVDFGRKMAERGYKRWRTGAKRGFKDVALREEANQGLVESATAAIDEQDGFF